MPRVLVWQRADKLSAGFQLALAACDLIYGVLSLAARNQSPSLQLLKSVMPAWLWALSLIIAGVTICSGHLTTGGIAGTFGFGVLAAVSAWTIVIGTALAVSAPVIPLTLAAQHALLVYGESSGLDVWRKGSGRGL